MALLYPVPPGTVLLCNYDTGFRPPEMVKRRPAVVISPRLPHREGLCTVVPLSTTPPERQVPYVCRLVLAQPLPGPFTALTVWAKADMLATVAFERLDLFRSGRGTDGRRQYLRPRISAEDLYRMRQCVALALGLGALTESHQ
ncbi:MAG: type II toxin-antitoxin system PemK/MazF family toxin [Alphaproteobacteria bacterium]|nr:type II toxin-antitoxin system PemK/MazF family toxin [Alphaproteobacteria bacterium]